MYINRTINKHGLLTSDQACAADKTMKICIKLYFRFKLYSNYLLNFIK